MIGIRLQGQLGNQLFQLSFIRLASKMMNEFYVVIDDNAYGFLVEEYFKLKYYEKKFFRRFLKVLFFLTERKLVEFTNWQRADEVLNNLKSGVLYKGFFQSQKYIDSTNYEKLRIKDKYQRIFLKKYGAVFKKYKIVVIHIRLTDYLEIGDDRLGGKGLQLPFEYYYKALEQIDIDDMTRVIVISDDYDYVRNNLKLKVPFTVERNHFIIDLLLMMNANKLVLSNSSFSWWGANLNTNYDLKVIVPEFWLGFKIQKPYPVEIISNSWSTVSVF